MSQEGMAASQAQITLRPELPREFVAAHKRRRIMDATAELIGEHGYHGTRIADIVRRAGIARKTLYENFDGKEAVFLAVFDATIDEAIRRIEVAYAEAGEAWAERIEAGLGAFLAYVAEKPPLARLCLIEAPSATPGTTKHYDEAIRLFIKLARRTLPSGASLPDTIEETLVGGVLWIVYQRVRRREAEQVEDLLAELSDFVMAPFVGVGVIDRTGPKTLM
jgi:AcrR family transcriptional regulator